MNEITNPVSPIIRQSLLAAMLDDEPPDVPPRDEEFDSLAELYAEMKEGR